MWQRGELDQLADRAQTASTLTGLGKGTRAHLSTLAALARSHDADSTGAVQLAQHALAAGEEASDAAAQTTALHALGEIARNDGRNDDALTAFRRMRRVARVDYFHGEVLSLQHLARFAESGVAYRPQSARMRNRQRLFPLV